MKNILNHIETVRQAFSGKQITEGMQNTGEVIASAARKAQFASDVLTSDKTQQAIVTASKNARNNIAGLIAKVVINHYQDFDKVTAAPLPTKEPKQTKSAPQPEDELRLV
jgi:hypothetical protein